VFNTHGFTKPLRVAEKLAMNVAGLVVTIGGGVTLNVVANVLSAPYLVPALLVATIRK
jgi:hypothetical protein